jgi:hypothetical protein
MCGCIAGDRVRVTQNNRVRMGTVTYSSIRRVTRTETIHSFEIRMDDGEELIGDLHERNGQPFLTNPFDIDKVNEEVNEEVTA